jgi:hypothetical protein
VRFKVSTNTIPCHFCLEKSRGLLKIPGLSRGCPRFAIQLTLLKFFSLFKSMQLDTHIFMRNLERMRKAKHRSSRRPPFQPRDDTIVDELQNAKLSHEDMTSADEIIRMVLRETRTTRDVRRRSERVAQRGKEAQQKTSVCENVFNRFWVVLTC